MKNEDCHATLYCELLANVKPLNHENDSKLIGLINESILNTHAHSNFNVTMHTVFSVEKPSETLMYK